MAEVVFYIVCYAVVIGAFMGVVRWISPAPVIWPATAEEANTWWDAYYEERDG